MIHLKIIKENIKEMTGDLILRAIVSYQHYTI